MKEKGGMDHQNCLNTFKVELLGSFKIVTANEEHNCWLKSIIGNFGVLLTKLYRKTGTICSVCSKWFFLYCFTEHICP